MITDGSCRPFLGHSMKRDHCAKAVQVAKRRASTSTSPWMAAAGHTLLKQTSNDLKSDHAWVQITNVAPTVALWLNPKLGTRRWLCDDPCPRSRIIIRLATFNVAPEVVTLW